MLSLLQGRIVPRRKLGDVDEVVAVHIKNVKQVDYLVRVVATRGSRDPRGSVGQGASFPISLYPLIQTPNTVVGFSKVCTRLSEVLEAADPKRPKCTN